MPRGDSAKINFGQNTCFTDVYFLEYSYEFSELVDFVSDVNEKHERERKAMLKPVQYEVLEESNGESSLDSSPSRADSPVKSHSCLSEQQSSPHSQSVISVHSLPVDDRVTKSSEESRQLKRCRELSSSLIPPSQVFKYFKYKIVIHTTVNASIDST